MGEDERTESESREESATDEEQVDLDAMGLEKRRSVIGGSYSPSFARQVTLWGVVAAIVVGAGIGLKLLADDLDKPPANNPDVAPWAQPDAPQKPPPPLQ